MAIDRPGPVRWLYYQYSGRLPEQYRSWVLHDATCRSWMLRVLVRGLVRILPIAALLFFLLGYFGGSWSLAAGSLLLGVLVVVRIALTGSTESVDARTVRHGYSPGYAATVRASRNGE
ncbi:DUF5313 family protein [Actinopolyspora halophila]|uniref:DUF5313 family protein n=1 Tax=Actinopolyspora halophila TaxID=1850 RepID=UPI00035EEA1D|nr:DUF5313 family protein [Actinopolyspora halophila]